MKEKNLVTISPGNSKLGKIPNISLVPVKDCGNCEHCRKDCYALKAYRMYPAVRNAWQRNSAAFRSGDWETIKGEVTGYLRHKKPRFFRIHVAGDFIDKYHFGFWVWIAQRNPETKFLAFTKMHDLVHAKLPGNFTVILSMWPGMPKGRKRLPRAWMQDGTETRVPDNAIECPGICDTCGMCWQLPALGRDVVFNIH